MDEDTQSVEGRRVQLSDFPDDLLIQIFARLPVNTLFTFERVSRTWKRCVGPVLNNVKVVVFGGPENCEPICSHQILACHDQQTLFVSILKFKQCSDLSYEINDENIDAIIRLLKRCPHVKCLDFDNVIIVKLVNLKKLVSLFPELECLCLGPIAVDDKQAGALPWQLNTGDLSGQDKVEWRDFAEEVAPKLVHLKICRYFNLFDFNWNKNFDEIDSISPDKLIELNLLIAGDRLRSVHLAFTKKTNQPMLFDPVEPNFSHFLFLRELKKRPQIETTLGIDWLSSRYHFEEFDQLTFIFTRLTQASHLLFRAVTRKITEFDVVMYCVYKEDYSYPKKMLKLMSLSSKHSVAGKVLIIFKTLECLDLLHVRLDENTFKCRFETLETLHLIQTTASDEADFAKLFGSMPQLKKLVIKIIKWQPNHRYLPGQSLAVLKRLEQFEFELPVIKQEHISMIRSFLDTLKLIPSLKSIKIMCYFNPFLNVPEVFKKALIVRIIELQEVLPATNINLEMSFNFVNKQQFDQEFDFGDVMKWYSLACQFEQISQKYTEEGDIHKIEITKKT